METSEYFSSVLWKMRRRGAITRADNHCAVCGSIDGLEVWFNRRDRMEYEHPADMVVLCKACYAIAEDAKLTKEIAGKCTQAAPVMPDDIYDPLGEDREERLEGLKLIWGKNGTKRKDNDALFGGQTS